MADGSIGNVQLAQEADHLARVNGEEEALRTLGREGIDADHRAAVVEQGPAAVAGIDRGIVLHGAGVDHLRLAQRRVGGRIDARHHAGRERRVEAARLLHLRVQLRQVLGRCRILLHVGGAGIAHGNDAGQLLGLEIAQHQRPPRQIFVRFQDGQVDVGSAIHHARFHELAVAAVAVADEVLLALRDHMEVGDQDAPTVDQEPRAGADALLAHRVDLVDAGLDLLDVESPRAVGDGRQQNTRRQERSANAAQQPWSWPGSWHVQHCNPPKALIPGQPHRYLARTRSMRKSYQLPQRLAPVRTRAPDAPLTIRAHRLGR